jgi:hypothetical protein
MEVQTQPRQKVSEPHFNKLGGVVHACNPYYIGGISRRIMVGSWPPGKNVRPYLKNN